MAASVQPLLLDIPECVETDRLLLRATRAGMGETISQAVNESLGELKPWMPWAREPQTPEGAEIFCRTMQAKWHSRDTLDFCIVRRSDGALVGKGGLHTIDWTVPRFEIGYWVRTSAAGQGIATEFTRALAAFARASLGANRVEITCDSRNMRSRRVAEKSGFTLEGIHLRRRRDTAGELADACMYARVF
ncbi:MAG TPA: GNAT family protein [Usitatibacter sp.]|nr:GNAT family protein [Usitatibacter sp.]